MSALALLEVLDRDGHVKHYLPVSAWPVSVGRALDNDLVLDDPHIAAHHLRVLVDESGHAMVEVGDTRNGLRALGKHWHSGQRVAVGDAPLRIELGDSHLRLRLAEHALEPEVPLRTPRTLWHAVWQPVVAGLLVLLTVLATTWIETDPEDLTRAIGSTLLTLLVAGVVWCALWSLISKIFTRRSHVLWHASVMLWAVLAIELIDPLAQLIAFSFSWPAASDFAFVPRFAIAAAMLYFHALGVEPRRPSRMRIAAVAMFIAGSALSMWFNVQNRDQLGDELYMNHLFPPALRLARTVDSASFVKGLAPIKAALDEKAKKNDASMDVSGGDDE